MYPYAKAGQSGRWAQLDRYGGLVEPRPGEEAATKSGLGRFNSCAYFMEIIPI